LETRSEFQNLKDHLQRLEDFEEIRRFRGLYSRWVDTNDWDTWKSEVLTEDYRLESQGGVQDERDQVVSSVSKSLKHGVGIPGSPLGRTHRIWSINVAPRGISIHMPSLPQHSGCLASGESTGP
jgi:hypothetical protein